MIACVLNFAPMPHSGYRIGLPFAGVWREAVNTDSELYGGSGAGNMGAVVAAEHPSHGQPASATITIPPLGALWLVPESGRARQRSAGRRSDRVGVLRASGCCWRVTWSPALPCWSVAGAAGRGVAARSASPGIRLAAERIDVDDPGGADRGGRLVRSAGSAAEPDPLANSADGDRAVAAVLADLQDFWTGQLSADGGAGLRPPAGGYVSMDSTRRPSGPRRCASPTRRRSPATPSTARSDDGIVFDSSALVPVLLGAYGSAGLAASFAHEFGHAVQAQVGPTAADRAQDPDRYPSILIEAQADCDAGAFLAWASAGRRRAGAPAAGVRWSGRSPRCSTSGTRRRCHRRTRPRTGSAWTG